jgi:hemin uptake protein HemP
MSAQLHAQHRGISLKAEQRLNDGLAATQKTVTLDRSNLPLSINYDGKRYILVLTKSNKLLLQKPIE